MSDLLDNPRKPDTDVEPDPPVLNLMDRPASRTSRFAAGLRNWAAGTFSRDQLMSALKSLAWVAPLTLMIWVYAEREQVKPLHNQPVPIEVVSTDPNFVVTLLRPIDGNITATLTGPQVRLDVVREKLDPQAGSPPVQIKVDPRVGEGRQRIRAINVGDDARFAANGVTVSNPQPEWLEVYIDPIVTREIPVRPPPDQTFVTPPKFEPATVQVRGPARVLDDMQKEGRLHAYAVIDRAALTTTSGQTVTLPNVRTTLAFDHKLVSIVRRGQVTATVDVARAEEYEIDFVRVFVVSPPGLLNDYRIEHPPTVNKVKVKGSREAIENLRKLATDGKLKATFEVAPSDVGEGKTAKLRYDLPDDVEKVSGDDQITFSLTRRVE